jgi:hypothetical protein
MHKKTIQLQYCYCYEQVHQVRRECSSEYTTVSIVRNSFAEVVASTFDDASAAAATDSAAAVAITLSVDAAVDTDAAAAAAAACAHRSSQQITQSSC